MKTCSKCGIEKELGEFYLTRYGSPAAACKTCAKAQSREWAIANPDRVAAAHKRFVEARPEKESEYAKKYNAKDEAKVKRRAAQNEWRKQNPEKVRAIENRRRAAHPERFAAKKARYYMRNRDELKAKVMSRARAFPEKVAATNARYYRAHPEKWVGRPAWAKKFLEKHAARQGHRRASKQQATPAWANEFFVGEAYALAKLRTQVTGIKWEVDHIVPLNHPLVQGLHVENNLQVIPAVANRSKSNRYWPDMPMAA